MIAAEVVEVAVPALVWYGIGALAALVALLLFLERLDAVRAAA